MGQDLFTQKLGEKAGMLPFSHLQESDDADVVAAASGLKVHSFDL